MELDIREAIDESVRLSEVNKNLVKELKKAVGVVDSQQREIHRLQDVYYQNMAYLIEIGKENNALSEKKNVIKPNKRETIQSISELSKRAEEAKDFDLYRENIKQEHVCSCAKPEIKREKDGGIMRDPIEASYVENLLKYRQSEEMFCFEDDVRKLEADFEEKLNIAIDVLALIHEECDLEEFYVGGIRIGTAISEALKKIKEKS